MSFKNVQLWLNQHYDRIKHGLFVTVGFILIVFAMVSYANSNRLLDRVAVLTQQNKQLSQDNKRLNQQNKDLASETQGVVLQNRSYIRCLANVFSQYTQDFVPVNITDLDSCSIQSTSDGTSQGSSSQAASTQGSSSNSPTPSSSSQPDNSQSDNSDQPPAQPNAVQRILNFINPFN